MHEQEHSKVQTEFEKSRDEIESLQNEKVYLKNKINEVLIRNGFTLDSVDLAEHKKFNENMESQ